MLVNMLIILFFSIRSQLVFKVILERDLNQVRITSHNYTQPTYRNKVFTTSLKEAASRQMSDLGTKIKIEMCGKHFAFFAGIFTPYHTSFKYKLHLRGLNLDLVC